MGLIFARVRIRVRVRASVSVSVSVKVGLGKATYLFMGPVMLISLLAATSASQKRSSGVEV